MGHMNVMWYVGKFDRELHARDMISIHSGILEVREKEIRFCHEMFNEATGEVAASTVITGIHFDRGLPKSVPFPVAVREQTGGLLVDYHPGI
jgi:acyl-CoA thioester hydrolase